jgi:hypothetical protein
VIQQDSHLKLSLTAQDKDRPVEILVSAAQVCLGTVQADQFPASAAALTHHWFYVLRPACGRNSASRNQHSSHGPRYAFHLSSLYFMGSFVVARSSEGFGGVQTELVAPRRPGEFRQSSSLPKCRWIEAERRMTKGLPCATLAGLSEGFGALLPTAAPPSNPNYPLTILETNMKQPRARPAASRNTVRPPKCVA